MDERYTLAHTGGNVDNSVTQELATADYIIARGQEGFWSWRKWASGIVECWGCDSITEKLDRGGDPMYYGASHSAKLPMAATVLSLQACNISLDCGSNPTDYGNAMLWYGGGGTGGNETFPGRTQTFWIMNPAKIDKEITYYIYYSVRGRWRLGVDGNEEGLLNKMIHSYPSATKVNDGDLFLTEQDGTLKSVEAYKIQAYAGGRFNDEVAGSLLELLKHVKYDDNLGPSYQETLRKAIYATGKAESIKVTLNLGSDTIYNVDKLDKLKNYLTVIAWYGDGSASEIHNYSLSGKLEDNIPEATKQWEATITVSYNGMSKDVAVPVNRKDPNFIVMSYNVQTFTGINAQEAMQRDIIANNNPDIIGFQEFSYSDSTPAIAANMLASYQYISRSNPWHYMAMASKTTKINDLVLDMYQHQDRGTDGQQRESARCYMKAYIYVNNKRVAWFNTHLSYIQDTPGIEAKRGQMQELFNLVRDEERFIITADFNNTALSVSGEDYIQMFKPFVDAGYNLANCTEKTGFNKTWGSSTTATSQNELNYATDCIITSGNIDIVKVEYDMTKFNNLDGNQIDHIPIIAKLYI